MSESPAGGEQAHGHDAPWWVSVLFAVAVGILLLLNALGIFTTIFGINTALVLTFLAGYRIIYEAMLDLLNRRLSAGLAIVIAALAAVSVGEYIAAAEAMFIMLIGEGLEHYAVARARSAIAGFVEMTPAMARVRRDEKEIEVPPHQVRLGETVIVRAGEKVPVDGVILLGQSSVNESMITGEPVPAQKKIGDSVYSGSINEYGLLEVRADKIGSDTILARIRHLIDEAQKQRAPIERTADFYARFFLPIVLLIAAVIYYFTGQALRAVAALIVACPCALVLATPAAVAASIARLAKEGVLVKGGGFIEALARIRCVAFDKTGTLTAGRPSVSSLVPAPGVREEELLAMAAAAERSSEHLLGRETVEEAQRRNLDIPDAEDFIVRPGLGVQAGIQGRVVRVGNLALAREALGMDLSWLEVTLASQSQSGQTSVAVTSNELPLGVISFNDSLRSDAMETVVRLKEMGIARICMITGDAEAASQHIGRQAGISEIHARLLPEQKAQKIREIRTESSSILMVGDGINDSPSLAMADVGIAMGRGAADLSAEAAHVVFLRDRLVQLPDLLAFARKVIGRIRSSILWFAFGVNLLALLGAAFGYLGPVAAAIVHQAASLFVILNCVRLLVEGKAVEERRTSAILMHGKRFLHALHHALSWDGLHSFYSGLQRYQQEIRRWTFGLAAACWVLSGIALIGPEQAGVVLHFGRWTETLDPGIYYRWPWPIDAVARVAPKRIQAAEIGYRTNLNAPVPASEPQVYGWNIQHREGRYRKVPEEALMLTGDENLVEVNAVVQFSIADLSRYLFRSKEPETVIRAVAERALRLSVARESLDAILTDRRSDVEATWKEELEENLQAYGSGMRVLSVQLQDVHPPVEVVEAFRDVASALEERSTRINEAEAYLREQLPLARGQSKARLLSAEGYTAARVERSQGESLRFSERQKAYRLAPDVTASRLYFESIEQVLPNKTKYITDTKKLNQRRFIFVEAKDFGLLNLVEPKSSPPEAPK